MQAENKQNVGSYANPGGLILSSKLKRKNVGGVSLLYTLKLNEFYFCKQCCQVFIMEQTFSEKCNITRHGLSGSRMVGEAFSKSLSINFIKGLHFRLGMVISKNTQ